MTGSDISGQDLEGGTPSGPPFSIEEQRKRARRMGIVNHFTRPLLSLPFQTPISKRLMLIELSGRKSGRVYKQPVSYVRDGDTLLTPGGGNWKLNLLEDKANRLHLNGKWVAALPELVRDPKTVTELLSRMHAANPGVGSLDAGAQFGQLGRPRQAQPGSGTWLPHRAMAAGKRFLALSTPLTGPRKSRAAAWSRGRRPHGSRAATGFRVRVAPDRRSRKMRQTSDAFFRNRRKAYLSQPLSNWKPTGRLRTPRTSARHAQTHPGVSRNTAVSARSSRRSSVAW